MIDITEKVNPHLKPFFMDWEDYKLHLEVTKVYENQSNNSFKYHLSGFVTLLDTNQNNERNIPQINDLLFSDTRSKRAIDIINDLLYDKLFKLLGCQNECRCIDEVLIKNHNIDNEVSIEMIR